MPKLRLAAQIFVHAVVLVAGAIWIWALASAPWSLPSFILGCGLTIVFRAFAQLHPIELTDGVKVNVCTAIDVVIIAALGLVSVAVVTPGAVIAGLISSLRRGSARTVSAFNAGNYVIATAAGGITLEALKDVERLAGEPSALAAIAISAVVYLLVTTGLPAAAVALAQPGDRVREWVIKIVEVLPQQGMLASLGTLLGFVLVTLPTGVLFLIVPIALAIYAHRQSRASRVETGLALELLATAIDQRDTYGLQHSQRVAELAGMICQQLELPVNEAEVIVRAARLHDIGKIALPPALLEKREPLTPGEWEQFIQHPLIGSLFVSRFSDYRPGKDFILLHHERQDGSGYPYGRSGDEVPLGARIIAVSESFDAMTTDRPYRQALSLEQAAAELRRRSGRQFDPIVVQALLSGLGLAPALQPSSLAAPSSASVVPA